MREAHTRGCDMFDDAWRYVDAFRVDQAAALWAGEHPPQSESGIADDIRNRIAPHKQMLFGAISTGKLKANHSTNVWHTSGNYNSSIVERDELVRFARTKGLFPAFLFDTIAPERKDQENAAEDQA